MTGPIAYIGGKNRLAKTIIAMLPEHITYVEPFAGGAQVLFHKTPSNVEVLNDLDYDVVNFFRVCQWHYEELIRYLKYSIASRKLHELHVKTDPSTLTDIQRAGRFFYLQKNSFGGLILKQKFHYGITQTSNFNPQRIPEMIERAHHRLQRVQVESLPYEQVLEKYDRPTTCFYLDPPYWERKLYKFNFTVDQFKDMAARLAGIQGKFILSLDDRPEVREVFRGFHLRPVDLRYTAKRDTKIKHKELLISNFDSEGTTAADGALDQAAERIGVPADADET